MFRTPPLSSSLGLICLVLQTTRLDILVDIKVMPISLGTFPVGSMLIDDEVAVSTRQESGAGLSAQNLE